MTSTKLKLVTLTLLSTGILILRFFVFTRALAEQFIVKWGYWVILISALLYAAHLGQFLYTKLSIVVWRKYRIGVIVSFFAAVFLQLHEPRQFKVQFDEFTLSGVARNMHYLRQATFPSKAHFVDDRFQVFQVGVDKRPLFFPFILSGIHDVTGYRPENVFLLNGIGTFLLLLLTYYMGAQYGGWRLGAICVALWLSLPLLAQNATGGGYDVFNVLMLALLWFFGREYTRAPIFLNQSLFILTAVHLAQVRLESLLYVVLLALVVLWQWVRQHKVQLSWVAVVSPLCLVGPLAINLVFIQTPSSLQTNPGQSYISADHLLGNLQRAIWYLFNFNLNATNSVLIPILGTISVVGFGVKSLSRRREFSNRPDDVFFAFFAMCIMAATAVMLSQFWGQWDDAAASRFSLPLHLLFIFCFARVVSEFLRNRELPMWVTLCTAAAAVVLSVSAAATSLATKNLWSGREYSWFLKELENPRYRGALVIAHPVGPIVYNHAAISVDVAEASKWKINECLKNGLYQEIIVLERLIVNRETLQERPYNTERSWDLNIVSGTGESGGALSPAFKKEKICETRLRANVISRISRITSVEGAESFPPREYTEEGPPFTSMGAHLMHIYTALP